MPIFADTIHSFTVGAWIILAEPLWLIALPAVLLPVIFTYLARRRGMVLSVPATVLQCLAILMLILAISKPMLSLGKSASRDYLLFIDGSDSVRGQDWLINQIKLPEGVGVRRYYFADGLGRKFPPSRSATLIKPVLEMINSPAGQDSAGAIIITDGQFTDTGWEGLAAAIGKAGVRVFISPLNSPPPDARVVSIDARRTTKGKIILSATLMANSAVKRTVRIIRKRDGKILFNQKVSLLPDLAMPISVEDSTSVESACEYCVSLQDNEIITENNSADAIVLPERRQIAAIGVDESFKPLLSKVKLPITYFSFADLPLLERRLMDFSGLVIVDSTGVGLSEHARREISKYVRTGGGLVMIGVGPHEKPGDLHDPLNEALPLIANPFERKPLRLVVLLDKSGSMSQPVSYRAGRAVRIKFDLAAQAVLALKDYLTPRDSLAVIVFANNPDVIYDSGSRSADFHAVADALKRVNPTGSTNVTPALKEALTRTIPPGRELMVLVVSDLKTEKFNPRQWANLFKKARAKLAVIAIRSKVSSSSQPSSDLNSPPLKELAKLAGASYIEQDRLEGLAEVFGKLVSRARGKVIRRKRLGVNIVGTLFGADISTLPSIDAYIQSASRKQAEILARTSSGEPIIASMKVGLGKSVCIALPFTHGDNDRWIRSSAVADMLAAAIRWILRSPNDPRFDVDISRKGNTMKITVTATSEEGEFLNGLSLNCLISHLAGDKHRQIHLQQVGSGKYQATVDFPADLPAIVAVRDNRTGKILWRGTSTVQYRQEYRRIGANEGSLKRLARLTGGEIVPISKLGEVLEKSYREGLTDIWQGLIGLSVLLMLIEWVFARAVVAFKGQKSFRG